MMSGRLVAPMKKTSFCAVTPSISVSSWFITRSPAPPASPMLPPRALAMESSSSKNRQQGAAVRALSNTSRTFASDSPNHIVSSSGPFTLMKLADCSRWPPPWPAASCLSKRQDEAHRRQSVRDELKR